HPLWWRADENDACFVWVAQVDCCADSAVRLIAQHADRHAHEQGSSACIAKAPIHIDKAVELGAIKLRPAIPFNTAQEAMQVKQLRRLAAGCCNDPGWAGAMLRVR